MDSVPTAEVINARRIGLISDTHFMEADGSDVPQVLLDALAGLDLVLHLGHISSAAALDRLQSVAPVLAVQTELDDNLLGDALDVEVSSGRVSGYVRVIQAGGLRIGAVHDLSSGRPRISVINNERLKFPRKSMTELLRSKFGQRVDVVAFANTHVDIVAHRDGVLFVNPGSPNLPGGRREGGPGTIAILDVQDGTAHVEIVDVAGR